MQRLVRTKEFWVNAWALNRVELFSLNKSDSRPVEHQNNHKYCERIRTSCRNHKICNDAMLCFHPVRIRFFHWSYQSKNRMSLCIHTIVWIYISTHSNVIARSLETMRFAGQVECVFFFIFKSIVFKNGIQLDWFPYWVWIDKHKFDEKCESIQCLEHYYPFPCANRYIHMKCSIFRDGQLLSIDIFCAIAYTVCVDSCQRGRVRWRDAKPKKAAVNVEA